MLAYIVTIRFGMIKNTTNVSFGQKTKFIFALVLDFLILIFNLKKIY